MNAVLKSTQYILQKKHLNYPDTDQGFTLLEMMISMTIIALIMLIVYASLRIGIKAWEKGENKMLNSQQYRIVLNLIQSQLRSFYPGKKGNTVFFKGDDNYLEFFSGISMVPGNDYGIVHVRYQVSENSKGKKLAFYEKNVSFLPDSVDLKDVNIDDYYELIPGLYEFSFEYLKEFTDADVLENNLQWQQTWDLETDKGLPRAVRLGYKADELSTPVYIVIPMKDELNP